MSKNQSNPVIDFSKERQKRLEENRRKTERIFLRDFLAAYVVLEHSKMTLVELVDISEEGCAFQLPNDFSELEPRNQGQTIPMRLYFGHTLYLEVLVSIKNMNHLIMNQKRYVRAGCQIEKITQTYPAYQQFVKFLKLYSEVSPQMQKYQTQSS